MKTGLPPGCGDQMSHCTGTEAIDESVRLPGLSSELEILFAPGTSALTRKRPAEQRPAAADSHEAVGAQLVPE